MFCSRFVDVNTFTGDLRVMALSNHVTYQNYDLVKRCLYLFASFPISNGFVPSCAFEYPTPHADSTLAIDYAAVYVVALYEYVNMTGDITAAKELWPVVQAQMDNFANFYINSSYISTYAFLDYFRFFKFFFF